MEELFQNICRYKNSAICLDNKPAVWYNFSVIIYSRKR